MEEAGSGISHNLIANTPSLGTPDHETSAHNARLSKVFEPFEAEKLFSLLWLFSKSLF
jgi:hypothetical protein